MKKLLDLNDGATLEKGVFPSLAKNQVEVWREASNVEFNSLRVKKAVGFTVEIGSGTIYAIAQAFADGQRRAYWAELADLYMYQGATKFHIGAGYTGPGFWSLEPWGTWIIATNETDPVQVWKDTTVPLVMATDLAGFTDARAGRRYRLLKKHQNHVLGYFGQSVDWCSESNPELWVPDINNSAGGLFLRDLDSDVIAACPLGPDFGIYSGDSMLIQRYVGEPFYFGFEPAIEGIGAVSDSAIMAVASKNYGMCSKGFFMTDGVGATYIDNPQINDWVFKPTVVAGVEVAPARFYPAQGRRTVGLHDEQNNTVKWFFLGNLGQIYGVGFNYLKGTWTILDQEITAAAQKKVFDTGLIGSRASFGFLLGTEVGANPMLSSLTTFPTDAGQRENYKLWDMLRVNFEGNGLQVRFGFQDDQDDAIDWTIWADLERENYINRESVFLTVEFRSSAMGADWVITGLSVHGEITGYL